MANMIGKVTLDFDRDELYVWEMDKSSLLIELMIEAMMLKHKLPSVDVTKNNNGIYELVWRGRASSFENYGGHHRALACYIEGFKMDCNLWDDHVVNPAGIREFKPIGKVVLGDDIFRYKTRDALSYFSHDFAEKICKENYLDSDWYLSQ